LLLVDDLGSGTLTDLRQLGCPAEATVQDSLAAGSDVVAFSGDKLMGGPQAGLLAGTSTALDRLRRHPLLRALRLDKLSLAALEATLRLHRERGADAVPVLQAMAQSPGILRGRAERLAALLGPAARVQATTGFAGGGSLPGEGLASAAVVLQADQPPDRISAALRSHRPAVAGRIADGAVLLDMLAVADAELPDLAAAVPAAFATRPLAAPGGTD
jgi:L-seryl-tRNA(Ser) seleniumtransferase